VDAHAPADYSLPPATTQRNPLSGLAYPGKP
jgi:hypothetical protein